MGESWVTIVVIGTTAVLMFVFPLMSLAERTDDISQLATQEATTDLVDNVGTTGVLTMERYEQYLSEISATGNYYDVDIVIQQLDENPGVKTTQAEATKIGENLYYTIYSTQVLNQLDSTGRITLKEGDIITVTAKNMNPTIWQSLKNAFYMISGNDTYRIVGQHTRVVVANGSTSN